MSLQTFLQRVSARGAAAVLVGVAVFAGGWAWHDASSPARRHIDLGLAKLQEGQGMAAAIEWREAVKLDPCNAQAWELLGDYYRADEDWTAAVDAFRRVQEVSPATQGLSKRLAMCALGAGEFEEARGHAEAALAEDPDDAEALRVAASVAQRSNRRDDYLKYLRRLAQARPRDVRVLLELCSELNARQDYAQVRALAERVLALDPSNTDALAARGTAFYNEDPTPENLERARADFESILRLKPGDAQPHRLLGRIAMLLGRPHEAVEHFEALGRGRPYASAHFLELAKAYRKAGQTAKSEAMSRRFFALKARNSSITDLSDRISRAPRELGNYLQMAALLVAGAEDGGDFYELCRFRLGQKQIEAPDFYVEQAARLAPRGPQVLALSRRLEAACAKHVQAALSAIGRGNIASARAQIDHALFLRPDDPRAREALLKITQQTAP